jgi:hypothetical protein
MKADVNEACVIPEHDFRAILWNEIVTRLDLVKVLQHDGTLPDVVVEFSVDCGWLCKKGQLNGRSFLGWK